MLLFMPTLPPFITIQMLEAVKLLALPSVFLVLPMGLSLYMVTHYPQAR